LIFAQSIKIKSTCGAGWVSINYIYNYNKEERNSIYVKKQNSNGAGGRLVSRGLDSEAFLSSHIIWDWDLSLSDKRFLSYK